MRTPGGTSITGDDDRHGFRYVAPAGDEHAGNTVTLALIDDDTVTVDVTMPTSSIPTQTWKRCRAPVS
jgi:hypothetical protein